MENRQWFLWPGKRKQIGGGSGYKRAVQVAPVFVKHSCVFTIMVDKGTYIRDKTVWNYIHTDCATKLSFTVTDSQVKSTYIERRFILAQSFGSSTS
jgi:hypothetical protein